MPIKEITGILKIEFESDEFTEIIHTAIDPDNLTDPPLKVNSVCTSNTLKYRINNVISVETMLATLMDLITVVQTAENALITFPSETG